MVSGTRKELKSVTASKAAALIGWLAQENKDRFGAALYDGKETWTFKPQQNRAHLLAVLKKISETGRKVLPNAGKAKADDGLTPAVAVDDQNDQKSGGGVCDPVILPF